jgi:succinyl-CoA synthetase alpha subunit
MSIFVNNKTRLLVQGITGREGGFHTEQCLTYGTNVVAGVTPGKGGHTVAGKIPVFESVHQAVNETGANVSLIFVPASFAKDAMFEAVDAGIELVICIAEGVPILDSAKTLNFIRKHGARLLGPNCPGVISPGERCKAGIMPGYIHLPGRVGVVSRSGTLSYEAVSQLTALGIGQSTCVGIGGDPIIGTDFVDVLKLFNEDPETEAIVLIGEIGGNMEQDAARYIKQHVTKPVAAFIAGATAPTGKRMGHAGAIITGSDGTADAKKEALEKAGVVIIPSPGKIGFTVKEIIDSCRVK